VLRPTSGTFISHPLTFLSSKSSGSYLPEGGIQPVLIQINPHASHTGSGQSAGPWAGLRGISVTGEQQVHTASRCRHTLTSWRPSCWIRLCPPPCSVAASPSRSSPLWASTRPTSASTARHLLQSPARHRGSRRPPTWTRSTTPPGRTWSPSLGPRGASPRR